MKSISKISSKLFCSVMLDTPSQNPLKGYFKDLIEQGKRNLNIK